MRFLVALAATALAMAGAMAAEMIAEPLAQMQGLDKIKVLNENLGELRDMAQDALEDAVLMGCDEAQFRRVVRALVDGLVNPYRKD